MGTPDFAVPSLKAILDLGCQVVGVVSQPDRKRGRGQTLVQTPVAACASAHDLPIYQWPRLNNDSYAILSRLDADVAVVVAYGKILPQRYLDIPRLGCLNVHASLLPSLRGAAPIQWAVINGEHQTGVSIMQLDAGMDTGDVAHRVETEIGPNETSGALHDRLAPLGAEALQVVLRQLCEGTFTLQSQAHDRATHARMLTKGDGQIDWARDAQTVHNHVRGMSPWPGAYQSSAKGPIKLHVTEIREGRGIPGKILQIERSGPVVACASGALLIHRIQRPGKRAVTGAEYVNALNLEVGDSLEGP